MAQHSLRGAALQRATARRCNRAYNPHDGCLAPCAARQGPDPVAVAVLRDQIWDVALVRDRHIKFDVIG